MYVMIQLLCDGRGKIVSGVNRSSLLTLNNIVFVIILYLIKDIMLYVSDLILYK